MPGDSRFWSFRNDIGNFLQNFQTDARGVNENRVDNTDGGELTQQLVI